MECFTEAVNMIRLHLDIIIINLDKARQIGEKCVRPVSDSCIALCYVILALCYIHFLYRAKND